VRNRTGCQLKVKLHVAPPLEVLFHFKVIELQA
jgi:hypothetical protein